MASFYGFGGQPRPTLRPELEGPPGLSLAQAPAFRQTVPHRAPMDDLRPSQAVCSLGRDGQKWQDQNSQHTPCGRVTCTVFGIFLEESLLPSGRPVPSAFPFSITTSVTAETPTTSPSRSMLYSSGAKKFKILANSNLGQGTPTANASHKKGWQAFVAP